MKRNNARLRDNVELDRLVEETSNKKAHGYPQQGLSLADEDVVRTPNERKLSRSALEKQNGEIQTMKPDVGKSLSNILDLPSLTPAGYFTVNRQGLILDARLGVHTWLGFTRKDFVAQVFSRFVLISDQGIIQTVFERLFTIVTTISGQASELQVCEFRMVMHDGNARRVRAMVLATQNGAGAIVYHVILNDTPEGDTEEKALYEREAKYRGIIETAAEGIIITLLDGTITYANRRMAGIIGCSADELIGRVGASFMSNQELAPDMRKTVSRGNLSFEEFEIVRVGGEKRWVAVNSSPILNDDKEQIATLGMFTDITERKKAERILKQSERKFHMLAESISDIFFAMDKDLKYTYWNKATEQQEGIPASVAIGNTLFDVFPASQERETVERVFRKTMETQRPQRVTASYPGDKTVIHEINAYPTEDGVSVLIKDVTDQKRVEEEMANSNERLTTILDSMDALVYVADFDSYELLFINKYGRELFGDVNGRKCWRYFQRNQNGPCPFCTNHKIVSDSGIPTQEYNWEFQNTVTGRWFQCRDRAISWPGKKSVRMEIATDITERKRLEEALRIAATYTRSLIETSVDPLATISTEGKVSDVNVAMERITGVGREQLVGSDFADYFTAPERARAAYLRAFSKGKVIDYPLSIRSTTGRTREMLYNISVLRDKQRQIVGAFAIARDITKQRRALQQLLRKSQDLHATVFETTGTATSIVEENGSILSSNKEWKRILGYSSRRTPRENTFWELFPQRNRRYLESTVRKYLLNPGNLPVKYDTQIKTCNGPQKNVTMNVSVIPGTKRLVVSFQDITQMQRAEKSLRSSESRLRLLSRSIINSQEAERAAFARELHDQMGQHLTLLRLDAVSLVNAYTGSEASAKLNELVKLTDELLDLEHDLATRLRPSSLDNLGLLKTIQYYAEDFERRTGISCPVNIEGGETQSLDLRKDIATSAYRVLQETLTNVLRHSKATQAIITVSTEARKLAISVADNGVGMNIEKIDDKSSIGLIGMRERALLIGGTLKITTRLGGGTKVTLSMPLQTD